MGISEIYGLIETVPHLLFLRCRGKLLIYRQQLRKGKAMTCPKCGAYSPYNTAVCNRCGAKLHGSDADKDPRGKRAGQYYSRARKSEWERNRDRLLAKANDTIDAIMADKVKRVLLIAAVIAVLAGAMLGCVSCVCGGCDGCSREVLPAVSVSDAGEDQPDEGMSEGSSEETPDAGSSGSDAGQES